MKMAAILVPFWAMEKMLAGEAVDVPKHAGDRGQILSSFPMDMKVVRIATDPLAGMMDHCWIYATSDEFPETPVGGTVYRIAPQWPKQKEAK
jgi:hypothetical protein